MYGFMKRVKTNALITAALYTLLGLVLLIWPALSTNVLCTALGAVLVLCGITDIAIFLLNRDGTLYAGFHLVLGVVLAAVGIWLMTRPTLVAVVIPRIMGALVCVHGGGDLRDALLLRKHGDGRWGMALALGFLTLALGAVLVFAPFTVFTTAVRIIGAFLVYDGISDFWISLRVGRAVKRAARDEGTLRDAVDADFREI